MTDTVPFRIGVVCTANRFRSVVVTATLAQTLAAFPVEVTGMAARGPSGQPAIAQVVTSLRATGLDLASHRSTACSPGLLATADLILVFEAEHAAVAISEAGADRSRTYLVREMLELLPPVAAVPPRDVDEVRALLARLGAARLGDFFHPAYQYADPVAGPKRRYPEAVAELQDMARRVGARLFGLPEPEEHAPPARRRWFRR